MSFATVRAYFSRNQLSRACFDFLANLFRCFVLALLCCCPLYDLSSFVCVELWLASILVKSSR